MADISQTAEGARRGPRRRATRQTHLLCFSHLRWDFVYQRPQHVLGRFARDHRVFFIEEPVTGGEVPYLDVSPRPEGVQVVVPHLPAGTTPTAAEALQRALLEEFIVECSVREPILWYYTPMALGFTRGLPARAVVYDCMDELSLFRGAPSELLEREAELLRIAHLVFTGGRSLYEAKRSRHAGVHLFPSSIDAGHFGKARGGMEAPDDQAALPRPRLGYCGVIDERMDLDLLAGIAAARPEWQLVMIGPVVKIDSADLPKHPNIHYLGAREYGELPRYIAGWDVALLPFAHNASTRFISPTKTPEYLAAGKPVVSTSIRDVVIPYGVEGLVRIADRVADFVEAVEGALAQDTRTSGWLERVDHFLADMSWDRTQRDMAARIAGVLERSRAARSAAVADPSSRTRQPDALAAG